MKMLSGVAGAALCAWMMSMAPMGAAQAADGGASKDDAIAMVKKGVSQIKAQGADKTYAAIIDKENKDVLRK